MSARRLVSLGLLVAVLLAAAGIASHGRPLAGGRGTGPTATFFDYVATTLFVLAAALLALFLYGLATQRGGGKPRPRSPWYLVSTLVSLAAAALIGSLILHHGFAKGLRDVAAAVAQQQDAARRRRRVENGRDIRNPHVRWDEVAILAALLGGTALVLLASRRTRLPRPWPGGRQEAVSLALDESLDDLRADPDLRRAIVAAYARMERALAAVGIARRPAEAPFEYVGRALTSLDASAEAAERLTALFEWAKFSHHEPGPAMRDDAIDALVAVRDELRRSVDELVRA